MGKMKDEAIRREEETPKVVDTSLDALVKKAVLLLNEQESVCYEDIIDRRSGVIGKVLADTGVEEGTELFEEMGDKLASAIFYDCNPWKDGR